MANYQKLVRDRADAIRDFDAISKVFTIAQQTFNSFWLANVDSIDVNEADEKLEMAYNGNEWSCDLEQLHDIKGLIETNYRWKEAVWEWCQDQGTNFERTISDIDREAQTLIHG